MIVHLSGDVDYDMLNTLVKSINELKVDDNLHIYFTCPQGGMTDVSEAIVDFINKYADRIGMTFYGEIFSSGMIIFLKTQCTKIILPDTRGMFHFAWQEMAISEGGKPGNEYDMFSMKEMKKSRIRTLEFLKNTKLSESEISRIKKGNDVYFPYERLIQLI